MGLPQAREAQSFYRSAKQRFEDARFLFQANRTTGAVYLAGYGVECILKSLIINCTAQKNRAEILDSFRGGRAHDFEWLQSQYRSVNGPPLPEEIREKFLLVNTWGTDYRYKPGMIKLEEANEFLVAAEAIIVWADGRM